MIVIDSLAGLKRAIAVPGVTIHVREHWQTQLKGTTRTPCKVQGNGYWFMGPNTKGETAKMWANIPKASELAFNSDGSVTFYPGTEKSWTLVFEAPN